MFKFPYNSSSQLNVLHHLNNKNIKQVLSKEHWTESLETQVHPRLYL